MISKRTIILVMFFCLVIGQKNSDLLINFQDTQARSNIIKVKSKDFQFFYLHHPSFDLNIDVVHRAKQKFNYENPKNINWFYLLGPYNDLWGSDVLYYPSLKATKPSNYFPIKNGIFNITSIKNNPIQNKHYTYLTVFGFPLIKLIKTNSNNNFYGSEQLK